MKMKPIFAALIFGTILVFVSSLGLSQWQRLKDDNLHDPSNPALSILQEPQDALGVLQYGNAGNSVDWVAALQLGEISPRASLHGDLESEVLDLDVVMTQTFPLAHVIFPHTPHTEWMSCEMCHEEIFVSKIGANQINMGAILAGEYCGVCHGAVSFPLTECDRCHSVRSDDQRRMPASGAVIEQPR
jgi:c(7)-type cytochrome triheme protein